MRQAITAFILHRFKVQLKRIYDSLEYNVAVRIGRRDPLLPPNWLHFAGGDYAQIGEHFFRLFVDNAGLKPHEKVLDVGCGTGRIARPLTKYLRDGSYDGIDIVAPSIMWCQRAYTPRHPNFYFHFADIYNKKYNPAGKYQASEYSFPFATSAFAFVFLTSVFTHMLPQDLENYLSEINRVLKSGGRCLITYFLLTKDSLKLIDEKASSCAFDYELPELPGCRVRSKDVPEDAIAYDESRIRELYQKYKLNISEPIRYGSWCGRKKGLSYQDIVVASKLV